MAQCCGCGRFVPRKDALPVGIGGDVAHFVCVASAQLSGKRLGRTLVLVRKSSERAVRA